MSNSTRRIFIYHLQSKIGFSESANMEVLRSFKTLNLGQMQSDLASFINIISLQQQLSVSNIYLGDFCPTDSVSTIYLTLFELVPILGVVSSGFLRTFRDPVGDVSLLSVEPFLLSFLLPKVFSCFVLFIFFSNFSWDLANQFFKQNLINQFFSTIGLTYMYKELLLSI